MVWNHLFGIDKQKNFDPQLLQSIEQKNNNHVKLTLQTDKSLCTSIDLLDTSLLHYAAEYGNKVITELLIKSGAKVDLRDGKAQTPLMLATKMRHKATIRVLLNHNADIYLTDNHNINALQLAVQQGFQYKEIIFMFLAELHKLNSAYEIARQLLKANCPLYVAAYLQSTYIVSYLLSSGRSIDEADSCEKQTALHIAVECGNEKMVQLLVDNGADVNAVDVYGMAPIYLLKANSEILKCLMGKKIDLTSCTEFGLMQMYSALVQGTLEDVKVILDSGVDLLVKDSNGWTAIHYLAKNSRKGIVGVFSEIFDKINLNSNDIDWNMSCKRGWSILHNAMYRGNIEFVKYLMDKGVDANVKTGNGETPFYLALSSKSSLKRRVECVKLIVEGGALLDNEIKQYFRIYKTVPKFSLLEPVLANLVLREAKGERISEKVFESIDCHSKLKDYVVTCRKELDGMKKENFQMSRDCSATLFDFLTESVDKFVYAHRDQLDEIVRKYKCNLNYYDILQKRYEVFSKLDPGNYM